MVTPLRELGFGWQLQPILGLIGGKRPAVIHYRRSAGLKRNQHDLHSPVAGDELV